MRRIKAEKEKHGAERGHEKRDKEAKMGRSEESNMKAKDEELHQREGETGGSLS